MAKTAVTKTWTRNSASASIKLTATYTVTETSTAYRITVTNWSVDYGGTSGSGADLAYVKDQRTIAITQGMSWTISFAGTRIANDSFDEVPIYGSWAGTSPYVEVQKTHVTQTKARVLTLTTINGSVTNSVNHSISAKPSYTVTYNANGGTGTVASQTKWYGENLLVSTNSYTKANYVFKRWNTTSTDSGTAYNAGSSYYTGNAALLLYAIWNPIISYNANGGSASSIPANQTKTYGSPLTLSSTVPTRNDFEFVGWGTTPTATTAVYQPGDSYTANTAVTLYAIWKRIYNIPNLTITKIYRTDANGVAADEGTYAAVEFNWSIFDTASAGRTANSISSIIAECNGATAQYVPESGHEGDLSGTGTKLVVNAQMDTDTVYTISVTITDTVGGSARAITKDGDVATAFYSIDIRHGGHGIAFGKPATRQDVMEIAFTLGLTIDTTQVSGDDKDLYDAIVALGWDSEVIII